MRPEVWLAASFAEGIDYQATMLQPVGGMDRIAAGFARALGDAVITGAEVLSLRRVEGGARVTWRGADGTVREEVAPTVLLAMSAPVLAVLDTDLPAERRAALESLRYSQAGKLAFLCARRFWEEDAAIYGGISWTTQDKNLATDGVELFFSGNREGPWQQIAKGLKIEGSHRWLPPSSLGSHAFFRLCVRDQAGNTNQVDTPQPVLVDDLSRPRGRLIGITPLNPGQKLEPSN